MFRKWLKDKKGSVAVAAAVILPVAVGFMGLGAEVSYWYFVQRKIQSAADAAAYAAAVQLRVGNGQTEMETEGTAVAVTSGYKVSIGTAVFNSPPLTGPNAGNANAVEVTLSEDTPRLLTRVLTSDPLSFSGRAVALVSPPGDACVIALDPSASRAVDFTGSADITLEACDVVANSVAPDAIEVSGSATVSVDCLAAVGGVEMGGTVTLNDCDYPVENSHVFDDPFEYMPEPGMPAVCEGNNTFGGGMGTVWNIGPGRYCGGFDVRRTVNLAPGVYVVDGGSMSVNAQGSLSGTGITFYLTNDATLSINGGADVQITAPTSGTYAGMLFYIDPDNDPSLDYTINGNASTFFNGAIYAASGTVRYNGSSSIGGGCTQVVARLVEVNGSAGLGTNCAAAGVNTAVGLETISLVE